ncbi:MAG TPA: NUDIX hydrolase [Dongiaceae bacterium]|nr:NUDIX hydrolase [Dongiaceae bacterium]
MKYCSQCGNPVSLKVPPGDNRERHVCDHCGTIHYQNPRIIAGTLPFYGDKVLLCRRAIEPRLGYWTLPAGFMENGETTSQAAARETFEEADAEVDLKGLYTLFNLPHISQVHLFFLADVIDGRHGPGTESLESRMFEEHEIPWNDLAFPTVGRTLKYYFEDRRTGDYPLRVEDITAYQRKP